MMDRQLFLTCVAVMFAVADLHAGEDAIQKIRGLYGGIESDIRAGRLQARTFGASTGDPSADPASYEGTTARCYARPGSRSIEKIALVTEMTNVTILREYVYYGEGGLAFYYEATRSKAGGETFQEDRYYFFSDSCIRVIEDREVNGAMKRFVFDPPLPGHHRRAADILRRAKTGRDRAISGSSPLH